MLFAWMGFLKAGRTRPPDVSARPPTSCSSPISASAGRAVARRGGRRAGMMMIFEAADRAAAEALVDNSPYQRAGLYKQYLLLEYRNEAG